MALAAFFLFAGLILYSYVVYPILLGILALLFGRSSRADDAHEPSVSVLIPAYTKKRSSRGRSRTRWRWTTLERRSRSSSPPSRTTAPTPSCSGTRRRE